MEGDWEREREASGCDLRYMCGCEGGGGIE